MLERAQAEEKLRILNNSLGKTRSEVTVMMRAAHNDGMSGGQKHDGSAAGPVWEGYH